MAESDRTKKLQAKVIYSSYLIERDFVYNGAIRNLFQTSGDFTQSVAVGPTSFTPVELNTVLVNNNVIVPELIVASGMSVPSSPQNLTGVSGNTTVILTWSQPESNGGLTITKYFINVYDVTNTLLNSVDVGLSLNDVVRNLMNGVLYNFRVYASNAYGSSLPSLPISVIPTAGIITAPSAPTVLTAVSANERVTVSWSVPNTGGSIITGYTVTSQPGGFTVTTNGVTTTGTVTGLTNGQAYTFTVVATNAVGTSVPSVPSAPVIPAVAQVAPGPPTAVTVISGNQQVAVSWTAPITDGLAITQYTVTSSPEGLTATTSGTTATVFGLTNGQAYTFTVVATNSVGSSVPSAPSPSVTPVTVPSAPTGVSGIAGNEQVAVSWTAPSTGGSVIIEYTVTSSPGGFTATSSGTTATVLGLTNGQAYTFTVVATNSVGSSVPSGASASVTPVTPATVPSAPTGVTGIAGNEQVAVSWTAPSNGGSAITGYTVTSQPGGLTATSSGTTATVLGLTNGQAYTFTVVATNAIGSSAPSAASSSVTPTTAVTVPGAPTGVTGIAGNEQVAVSWTAPNNGGSAITSYTVTSSPGGFTATSSGTTATVLGLTNGQAYTFTVVATNAVGSSAPSAASASVTPLTPATVPSAPTGVTGIAGNQQVAISWTAPSTGGSPITGYTVTSSPGGLTATSSGTTATVLGLTNGQAYTFTVVATNAVGSSAASAASASVTPATVPGAPINVTGEAGNQQVVVSWTAPSTGGSPITGYTVTSQPGGFTATSSGTTATVLGLTNGTSYTFTVVATNAVGSSPPSSASASVTPTTAVTVPSAPTGVTGIAGNQQVSVSWTAPSSGGSAITAYTVTSSPGGFTSTTDGVTTTTTVLGLTNGTSYTFTVVATNAVGTSAPSAASASVTPVSVPSAPTGVSGIPGNQQVVVSWTAPSTGGSPITGYTVTSSPGGLTATTSGTTATVTGLTNGISYTFTVVATNAVGSSVPSGATASLTPVTVPSAPTGVTAVKGNTVANVSWNAPISNGGAEITTYIVTSNPEGLTLTRSGTTRSGTITGLTNGTSYTFTVIATNSVGNSVPSAASNSVTPVTVPSAPTGVSGVAGLRQATIFWNAPANTGSPITSYTVTSQPEGITATTTNGTTRTIDVTGLTAGQAYTFTVIATNTEGNSLSSAPSVQILPYDVPLAPTNVTAVKGNTSALVSWTASNNRGATVTAYTVTSTPGSFTATTTGGTTATVTGLTNGTSYTFRVTATNLAGTSDPSAASNSVTPATVPDPPTNVTGVAGVREATISWTAPVNTGSPITSYTVTSQPEGITATTINGTTTTIDVTGLTAGQTYTFTVISTSIEGNSLPSAPSSQVILSDVTGAPTDVTAIAGDTIATVNWSEPSILDNMLAPIFYTVTSNPGGITATTAGAETTATVTGLTNGTSYTFTVVSVNPVGNSVPSSPSTSIVVGLVPDAPTNLSFVAGDGQVSVSWTAPASIGTSPIISYTVNLTRISGNTVQRYFTVVNSTASTAIVTGLTNTRSYTTTVIATNSTGDSPPSEPINSTPGIIPGIPQGVSLALGGNSSVTVSWNPSSDYITSYSIDVYDASNILLPDFTRTVDGSYTTINITGLTNDTLYKFTVTAINESGQGTPSSPVSITVYTNPSTIDVSGTLGDGQATISWEPPADDGGKAIVGYRVSVYDASNTLLSDKVKDVSANVLSTTITGLTNGILYKFNVSASNGLLFSYLDEPISVTPGRAPSAPTPSILTSGYDFIDIGWSAPNNGGYPITSYTVYVFDSSDVEIPELNKVVSILSATIDGLTNGLTYKLSVAATNVIGTSAQSAKLTAPTSTSNSVPAAPLDVSTIGALDEVTVNWSAPGSDGGSAITAYKVTVYDASDNQLSFVDVSGDILTKAFTSLNAGILYKFTVTASNTIGIGASSNKVSGSPQNIPGAVVDLSGSFTGGNVNGTLTWSPPSNIGGTPITSYTVDGTDVGLLTEPISYPIVAVVGISSYTYIVRAVNAIGTGPPSTITITYVAVPSQVGTKGTTYAHAGNTQIYLEWEAPDDGGSPLISYTIKIYNMDSETSSEYTISPTKTSELITNLINGTPYQVGIKATNIGGSSPEILFRDTGLRYIVFSPFTFTPAGVPSQITNVSSVLSANGITVSWAAPNQGDSAIIDYTVIYSFTLEPITTTSTSITLTQLPKGEAYTIRVFATNTQGDSIYSLPTQPILIPATAPDAVTQVESTYNAENSEILVTWSAPNDGGSVITSYTITSNQNGTVTTNGSTTSKYFTSLTGGVSYTFSVSATNAIGTSEPSAGSSPLAIPAATVPSKITVLSATFDASNNEIIVNWTAPNTGRSPITSYTVTSNQNDVTTTALTTATFTSITSGLEYTFTITATNAIGTSEVSDPTEPLTPVINPDAPTNVSGTAGVRLATVSWTAPVNTYGSPITGYTVTSDPDGITATTDGTTTTTDVIGLTAGQTYTFTVFATNSQGNSLPSAPSAQVILSDVPNPPTNIIARTFSGSTAQLEWTNPVISANTLPPTTYTVYSDAEGFVPYIGPYIFNLEGWNYPEIGAAYLDGLVFGRSYTFTVLFTNDVGDSIPSLPSNTIIVGYTDG